MAAIPSNSTSHPVALFDDLGLLVQDFETNDPSEHIIFKLLEMKALLATAFELDGFTQGVAINSQAQSLAVKVSRGEAERHYLGFKTQA